MAITRYFQGRSPIQPSAGPVLPGDKFLGEHNLPFLTELPSIPCSVLAAMQIWVHCAGQAHKDRRGPARSLQGPVPSSPRIIMAAAEHPYLFVRVLLSATPSSY